MSSAQLPLSGKVAIVTGGSRGIGKAICLKLAQDGAKVVVNYSSSSSSAEVVQVIGSENSIAIKADVGNVKEISHLIEETVSKFGKIDILVACAGIMPLNELEKVTEGEFDNVFDINVKGPLFLAQVCLSYTLFLKESGLLMRRNRNQHHTCPPARASSSSPPLSAPPQL
jgi:3-oxoacyl-[acyl-carrier protein] reductase